jgi:hypothetical protein
MKKIFLLFILSFIFINFSLSQTSGKENRKTAIHNGNRVKTVFGNWGVIGQPATQGRRGAWIYDNNGYIGDVSLLVGAEVYEPLSKITFHSVVTCPMDRPATKQDESPSGKKWTFEPVSGYDNPKQDKIALSTNTNSWPEYWPDKLTDLSDPGWRGSWNGYFGKNPNADQESIFVMDDNNDERFNFSTNNTWGVAYKPIKNNSAKNGLGLEVKVRGLQWASFLAQDNIFWLYEITNHSDYNYNKCVFGMLVGTYVGVTSTEDYHEYDDDWSFFDVMKDLTYTGDYDKDASRNPSWTGPVGMVGYAFLESPGNPYDGIDNDRDTYKENRTTTAPKFKQSDFDARIVKAGDTLVVIDTNYNRSLVIVEPTAKVYKTRGFSLFITPGETKLTEGAMTVDGTGKEVVSADAYDGVDNDFDGLIDENYQLHYRQVRKDASGTTLFDILNPTTYKDYVHKKGLDEKLIDEKRDNNIDDDGDWNPLYDDIGSDGVANTNDFGENDGEPTHGEPNFDETDIHESDQIGLTSFQYFTPSRDVNLADKEDLWKRMAPGYFDVPKSIVNGKPTNGEDGDFIYGTGYFPLLSGKTERLSLALVYGGGLATRDQDIEDLNKHRETVQKIYNSNYRFPQPPDKPTLKAIAGNKKVTLYWNRKSEYSFDPVQREYDFEGYKIYRATDPNFNDINSITDANGNVTGFVPLAQYDLIDNTKGYFRASQTLFQDMSGLSFYLGKETGLQHSYIDENVENGRRYYYAVVAYDRGSETSDIFPSENTKFISILTNGTVVTDINTAVVTPNAETGGYVPPSSGIKPDIITNNATGSIYYNVVDETAVKDDTYEISFDDTRSRGEYVPYTTTYSVKDLTTQTETFTAADTFFVKLNHTNLIKSSITLATETGTAIPTTDYYVDTLKGRIKGLKLTALKSGTKYKISYLYYPIYQSPYITNSPYISDLSINPNMNEAKDADIFDGIELTIKNDWKIELIDSLSKWNTGSRIYSYGFATEDGNYDSDNPDKVVKSYKNPSNYEIRFYDQKVDTSAAIWGNSSIPVNFSIYNTTDNKRIKFVYTDFPDDYYGKLSPMDQLFFIEKNQQTNEDVLTWLMIFTSPTSKDTAFDFKNGDVLKLATKKAFRKGDVFRFKPTPAAYSSEKAKTDLDLIKVVPNPYIAATTHEDPLPPSITTGRGTRKVDFTHIPPNSTINIFTARGEHVVTLYSGSTLFNSSVSWNLKSKENLDVAYGVYFYIVEAPNGKKSGKLAIIK